MGIPHLLGRPTFIQNPIAFCRWASIHHTAIFWSCVFGIGAFPMFGAVMYVRDKTGWEDAPRIPQSWPIPAGPRKPLNDGGKYDDPE